MYHFIGIKGAGMSALAQIMHNLGYTVQGSDYETHFFTEEGLIELGIKVLPFDENNIKEDMKIVRGATYDDEHPEVKKALELGLNIYSYSEMVGSLTKKFKTICVSGCHGKTTTTSMLAHVFKQANYLIGDGTGFSNKENELFILESCEYKRHFLNYSPYYAIITNIDFDHVDYFKDINDVIDAYTEFANKTEKMVIACGDDRYIRFLELNKPIFYYGINDDNDIIAKNIEYKQDGISFEVEVEGNYYGFFDLPIYGKHMLMDALATISVCYYERVEAKEVARLFKTFKGAKRRFSETIVDDTIIIDDYAHHPNEVKATIKAVKQKYPDKKIITVFQPHTFSRTKEFYLELSEVMNLADYSYVMDIHKAREKQEDYLDVTSNLIIDNLNHGESIKIDESEKLVKHKGSVILFMSPNDISKIENELKEKLIEINL